MNLPVTEKTFGGFDDLQIKITLFQCEVGRNDMLKCNHYRTTETFLCNLHNEKPFSLQPHHCTNARPSMSPLLSR